MVIDSDLYCHGYKSKRTMCTYYLRGVCTWDHLFWNIQGNNANTPKFLKGDRVLLHDENVRVLGDFNIIFFRLPWCHRSTFDCSQFLCLNFASKSLRVIAPATDNQYKHWLWHFIKVFFTCNLTSTPWEPTSQYNCGQLQPRTVGPGLLRIVRWDCFSDFIDLIFPESKAKLLPW